MDAASANLAVARNYLKAIEERRISDSFADFFAPYAIIETMPNRLLPRGRRDNLAGARAAAEAGKKVLVSERYEITNEISRADAVALEVQWTGTLSVPYESIPAGGEMRARFAMFLQFQDGKIVAQRNYDCFDPW